MSGTSVELSKLVAPEELVKMMECPVCHEIPLPPIFMCTTGHNICKNCKQRLPNCPICKSSWVETRNYTLEAIVRASQHVCPNRGDGCLDEPTGDQMENHLVTCKFRAFPCPLEEWHRCQMNALKLTETIEHLMDKHNPSKLGPGLTVCKFLRAMQFCHFFNNERFNSGLSSPLIMYEVNQESFLIPCFTSENTLRVHVLHIGREEASCAYRAKITLRGRKDNAITWNVPVQSIMIGSLLLTDTNMEKSLVASCSPQVFKQIADRDETKSRYLFTIKCEITKD